MDAQEIKTLRLALGWTQRQMAAKIGVDVMTISRWEHGMKPKGAALRALQQLQSRAKRRGLLPGPDTAAPTNKKTPA